MALVHITFYNIKPLPLKVKDIKHKKSPGEMSGAIGSVIFEEWCVFVSGVGDGALCFLLKDSLEVIHEGVAILKLPVY